ncbi:MAG: hypothetical protein L0209_00475 [candidate division Zixibacteria bacterium]|nr:hypothetical protein [candidate division Zixibacteria bacterium]
MSIPLFNDLNGKFTGKYKIDAFPTVVGVDDKGKVAFVEVGSPAGKKAQDYLDQL